MTRPARQKVPGSFVLEYGRQERGVDAGPAHDADRSASLGSRNLERGGEGRLAETTQLPKSVPERVSGRKNVMKVNRMTFFTTGLQ